VCRVACGAGEKAPGLDKPLENARDRLRSLPDLFTFFAGGERVTRPSHWPARAAEQSDLLQYYLYGYKQPTRAEGSVFGQVPIPATTIVNFGAVFDFTTFTVELPAGSYTLNLSTFVISPVMSFVATQPFTAPAGYQSWAAGDTWNTPTPACSSRCRRRRS
jgi:hypothetical protein